MGQTFKHIRGLKYGQKLQVSQIHSEEVPWYQSLDAKLGAWRVLVDFFLGIFVL